MKKSSRFIHCLSLSSIFLSGLLSTGWAQDNERDSKESGSVEAQSLNGVALQRLEFSTPVQEKLTEQLHQARQRLEEDPSDPDHLIWYGRRLAYLSRFQESIEVFSIGVAKFPEDARFLRHRGHRWITVRQFGRAVEDLEAAANLVADQPDQIEPDGQPNAAGIPTSTLKTNIWYHLGLARFFLGEFEQAEKAFEVCLEMADNNDMRVATIDWLFMTLSRMNRKRDAERLIQPIDPEMEILENHAYHRRLLLYRGLLQPSDLLSEPKLDPSQRNDRDVELATNGFGVGHWYLIHGNQSEAIKIFQQVTEGKNWAAFGFIAAEVELQRLN